MTLEFSATASRGSSAGGMVHYDWQWHNGVINNFTKPPAPLWLVDRLGVDYFGHVTSVSIWNLKSPDQGLEHIANLTRSRHSRLRVACDSRIPGSRTWPR